MIRIHDAAASCNPGFVVPAALRAVAQREMARVRASRSLFARLGESLGRSTFPKDLIPRYASRASFYKHCKAQLTQALAPYWQGSRSDLKARVREILHPRRRDVSLLSGLLRATVAPAALAIFMLAATAESAHADRFCTVSFNEQSGFPNPFEGVDVGVYAKPTFADLDGDGDLDVLVGETEGTLKYFRNTGTALAPVFVEQTGGANPFDGVDVGLDSAPAFADLDGDGDQDALVGERYGTLRYFQNTGSALVPVFVEQTGGANAFDGADVGYDSAPAFADLDGDADLDALVGERFGTLRYFQNTGTALVPVFVEQTDADNPFNGVDIGSYSTPAFADLDGDGDLDALVGENEGTLNYFPNTGTALVPVAVEQTGGANPFDGVDVGAFSAPAFADLDRDGDVDALVGASNGALRYFHNTSVPLSPAFTQRTGPANPFEGVDVGFDSAPAYADLDGDGDQDVLVGEGYGPLKYFRNTGTQEAPAFEEQTGGNNPFDGVDIGVESPAFADLDGDGDLDALIGEGFGTLRYFLNTGTALAPVFVAQTGSANPFDGVDVGDNSAPAFADLDGDGDVDALVGASNGTLRYFRNTGTPLAPVIEEQTGADNPFNGVNVGSRSTLTLGDLDGDGDLDALAGEFDGTLNYFLNTGTALAPVLMEQTGAANPFDGVHVSLQSTPVLADLDGDGDLDVLVGEIYGTLKYFLNTGTALDPAFVEQTGLANPFDSVDVENFSAPAFADLDGDGDVDALVGAPNGTLRYFQNTGTALAPVIVEQTGAENPFNGVNVGSRSTLALGDLDGDGDQDALVGEFDGTLRYFQNTGTALAPVFVEQMGPANPFDGVNVGDNSTPAFADLDGDGDLDALVGAYLGTLRYFRNTGTAGAPVFVEQTGGDNPFDSVDVGYFSAPAFADLDGDGDQDALVGDSYGTLRYFQNTSTALAPAFVEQTDGDNPFGGVDVGDFSTPAFADLDGDGDQDTLVGEYSGTLKYFQGDMLQDSVPPVITLTGDAVVTVECGSEYSELGATADDACAGSFAATVGGDTVDTAAPGQYNVTYNATNGVNPANEVTRSVIVQDTSGPVIQRSDDEVVFVECGSTYTDAGATASDACTGAVSVTTGGDTVEPSIPGTYTITYNATDGVNPANEVTRTVIVQDTTGPVIQRRDDEVVFVECGGTYTDAGATASDACAGSVSVIVGGDTVDTATPGDFTIAYNATDGTNAAIEVTRTVIVQDTTGPVIQLRGNDVVEVECGGLYFDDGAYATDSCGGIFSVTVGGDTVDTATPGNYTITYNATDGFNPAIEVTQTVIVLDNCPPEGEGAEEGEGVTEGATDGEGVVDGEGTADGEGSSDGEGGADDIFEQLLQTFALAEYTGNKTLKLAEIQFVLPEFTYLDLDDADYNGDSELSVGELLQHVGGGILSSADTNGDFILQLTELLRLIQLYNAGLYACAENAGATEDGFSLSATLNEPNCVLHSIDRDGNKIITLSELLRGIQLFNLGGYTWCPGTGSEDDFCG